MRAAINIRCRKFGADAKVADKNKIKEHCILLADDEEILLQTCAQLLNVLGYDVVTAENGHEALDLFLRDPERFSLVMLDDNMPLLSGMEVCSKIRASNPSQKLLICSGYTLEEKSFSGVPNLAKPYTIGDLQNTLKKLLD